MKRNLILVAWGLGVTGCGGLDGEPPAIGPSAGPAGAYSLGGTGGLGFGGASYEVGGSGTEVGGATVAGSGSEVGGASYGTAGTGYGAGGAEYGAAGSGTGGYSLGGSGQVPADSGSCLEQVSHCLTVASDCFEHSPWSDCDQIVDLCDELQQSCAATPL